MHALPRAKHEAGGRHRSSREGFASRATRIAPNVGKVLLVGVAGVTLLLTPSSSAHVAASLNQPRVEGFLPSGLRSIEYQIAAVARRATLEADVQFIRQSAHAQAQTTAADLETDPLTTSVGPNSVGSFPNPKATDPKQGISYYPGHKGGYLEVDRSVVVTNADNPSKSYVIATDESFNVSGNAAQMLHQDVISGRLTAAEVSSALQNSSGFQLTSETVSAPPAGSETITINPDSGEVSLSSSPVYHRSIISPATAAHQLGSFIWQARSSADFLQAQFSTYRTEPELLPRLA